MIQVFINSNTEQIEAEIFFPCFNFHLICFVLVYLVAYLPLFCIFLQMTASWTSRGSSFWMQFLYLWISLSLLVCIFLHPFFKYSNILGYLSCYFGIFLHSLGYFAVIFCIFLQLDASRSSRGPLSFPPIAHRPFLGKMAHQDFLVHLLPVLTWWSSIIILSLYDHRLWYHDLMIIIFSNEDFHIFIWWTSFCQSLSVFLRRRQVAIRTFLVCWDFVLMCFCFSQYHQFNMFQTGWPFPLLPQGQRQWSMVGCVP